MELTINLKDSKNIELKLTDSNELVDELIIPIDNSFDTLLVTSIDKIFKKNRIDKSSLKVVNVAPETDNGSVAYRTARAVGEALKS